MTKMKRITFKFSKPLTEKLVYQGIDTIQEEIMYADVNGIREKIAKELKKTLKSIGVVRFLNPALFALLEYRVEGLKYQLDNLVDFRKIDDLTYIFIYPMDLAAMVTVKNVGLKLGLLRIKDRDLQLAKVIREKELIEAFQKFSFKEMKLEPGSWTITSEEFDAEPAPSEQKSVLSPETTKEASLPAQPENEPKAAQ